MNLRWLPVICGSSWINRHEQVMIEYLHDLECNQITFVPSVFRHAFGKPVGKNCWNRDRGDRPLDEPESV